MVYICYGRSAIALFWIRFSVRFFGHCRWLRDTAYIRVYIRPSCEFCTNSRWLIRKIRTEAAQRLYRNRAISVQSSHSLHKLSTEIGARATSVWLPWSGCTTFWQHVHRIPCVFCTIIARYPNGARAGIVHCQLRNVYGLCAYDY